MDDEDGERRVRAKQAGDRVEEVDRLRNLPDCLLFQILLKLPTKDVVKCSVLSRRWRNIWRYVPGLDFECRDFMASEYYDPSEFITMLGFVYRFLGFNNESCLEKFKLTVNWYEGVVLGTAHFTQWINTVVERKVQHLHILDKTWGMDEVVIPRTVYWCESLVSLTLCDVYLLNPPELVSLPSLKVIVLDAVMFDNDLVFEMLISGCPVLESLTVNNGNLKYLQVCSQSLLTFTHVEDEGYMTVAIDAPRLEYLRLSDKGLESLIIECHGSLVKADIDTVFDFSLKNEFDPNDLPTTHMIRDFLVGISCVKDMIISSSTLEVIYDYSRCEKLPLFCNISFLRVEFTDDRWEMLPIFLESCPNLKSLVLEFCTCPEEEKVVILPGPRRFLTSLEYVKIVKSDSEEEEEATEINLELVSYLLENSAILKKLTLCLGYLRRREESVILRKLLTIPRLSTSCQVFVL
ncbi:PREDICTED: FBD-associated F-box protein At4g13985 [Camelina sativa]|uniref:FBD-associated F-box protein At4g13985 n=1 Tax=Camelina sativa TaxID=90675 RepID=A0ABM1QRP4_CAMSA|nr:PREDICTED: FBD-associated F-box protein At4g13985 [Camelina sativa]